MLSENTSGNGPQTAALTQINPATTTTGHANSRFLDPVVIDAESLASLQSLGGEIPPLRLAVDQDEYI